jgi:1,6-anhydro-N-acetylmuramate kinase
MWLWEDKGHPWFQWVTSCSSKIIELVSILGGFSNISVFQNQSVLAYDICAVNTVLNFLAHRLDLPYDEGGKIAASGKIIATLFKQLEKLRFYSKEPPKSLGIEWVQECIFSLLIRSTQMKKHKICCIPIS